MLFFVAFCKAGLWGRFDLQILPMVCGYALVDVFVQQEAYFMHIPPKSPNKCINTSSLLVILMKCKGWLLHHWGPTQAKSVRYLAVHFQKGTATNFRICCVFYTLKYKTLSDPSMSWDPKKWIYPINPILGMGLGTLGGVWIHRENTVHVKGGSKRYIRKSFHQKPSTNSDFLPARFPRSLTTKSQGRQVPCKTQRMLL